MGKFVSKLSAGTTRYDTITPHAFKKVIETQKYLKTYTFVPEGRYTSSYTYFDTPENLLKRAGVLLYKSFEYGKHYIKLEKTSNFAKISKFTEEQIYVQKAGPKDTPQDHAYFLIEAITTMFATQFNIDLENVIKAVVPKMIITSKGNTIKVFSGTGFKCNLILENCVYHNLETKRKVKKEEVIARLDSPTSFLPEYKKFNDELTKFCKDIMIMPESRYDHSQNITKILIKQPKVKKDTSKKRDSIIEG